MNEGNACPSASVGILVPKTPSGFFAGVSIKNYLSTYLKIVEPQIIEVMPCQLKQLKINQKIDKLYVLGLGIKNTPPSALKDFIGTYEERIALWVDHHPGSRLISELKGKYNYLHGSDKDSASTTALMGIKLGKCIKQEWIDATNHFENPFFFLPNHLVKHYKKIIVPANGQTKEAKKLFSEYLLTGKPSIDEIHLLLSKQA